MRPPGSNARLSILRLAATLWFVPVALLSTEPGLSWGPDVSGLRIGTRVIGTGVERTIQVVFQNTSPGPLTIISGYVGNRPFDVFAGDLNGGRHVVYPVVGDSPGRLVPIGLATINLAEIPSGRQYEFRLYVSHQKVYANKRDTPLEELLQQGYALHVEYSVSVDRSSVQRLLTQHPNLWTGDAHSGSARLSMDPAKDDPK